AALEQAAGLGRGEERIPLRRRGLGLRVILDEEEVLVHRGPNSKATVCQLPVRIRATEFSYLRASMACRWIWRIFAFCAATSKTSAPNFRTICSPITRL